MKKTAVSPTRSENYSEWYQQVIKAADLADHSPVRGCMVIKPWGYSIWENIQRILNRKIKETGHENAYFPLFIPLSFMEKEAQHVEGFAKECAVVTHHRLEKEGDKLVPKGELEEPLVVRPTSEMMISHMFSKWIESYRDLPLKINQWANVVRWEMRTRMFLRTTEFLWQEGHTVHSTSEEAVDETYLMLSVYENFLKDFLAMDPVIGKKTESEKFPGAVDTYCLETMMQDKKALQAGTTHFLGQNFAKSSDITFRNEDQQMEYGWMSSWGVTTRLIGGLIMTHSDDNGLVLPPRISPLHVVLLPVVHNKDKKSEIENFCFSLKEDLQKKSFFDQTVSVHVDDRDLRGGEKKWSWVKKGVPIYIEIGPRDMESDSFILNRRDGSKMKFSRKELIENIKRVLEEYQHVLFEKASLFRKENSPQIDDKKEFYQFFEKTQGGFALSHWCGDESEEKKIKEELNISIRCIPLFEKIEGKCIFCGKSSPQRVVFSKAY